MHRKTALLIATFLAVSALPASAQGPFPNPFEGTPEEQAACRPDVHKFCRAYIPDTFQILGCLQANRPKLRPVCRQVLANRGV